MNTKGLEAGWREFERTVVPAEAGPIQRQETRRAFYAGAIHLFGHVTGSISPGDDVTEADLRILTDLQAEMDQYVKDLAAGAA